MKKILITLGVLFLIATIAFLNVRFKREPKVEVEVTEVKRRKVSKVVTASGRIKPKRRVNVSATAMGKITKIAVKEGDYVNKGDFLLQIDPTEYRSTVERLEAAVRAAEAALTVEKANLEKAEYDFERGKQLFRKGFLSEDELKARAINYDIQKSRVKSARQELIQRRATLESAMYDLDKVKITAEMSGVVTTLNVEEGENAIMGTLNVPGTILLTISDLSAIEAEVEVDETEVIYVEKGQKVKVMLDAYPDTSFSGTVTQVGNSAITTPGSMGEESVDFRVLIAINDSIPNVKPGLSASTEITVAEIDSTLSVPIQCLTVRRRSELEKDRTPARSESPGKDEDEEIEGVFVVKDGRAEFRRIEVGIIGEDYLQVKAGLEENEKVVSGPFKVLTDLKDGSLVKIKKTTG